MALSFSFGSVDITGISGVELLVREVNQFPNRSINNYKLARADKSVLTSAEYSSKTIILSGNIKASDGDRTTAETIWQSVKSYLGQTEQDLVITQYGQDVKYVATVNRITDKWLGGYMEWDIEFLCSDPIGSDLTASTFIDSTTFSTATKDSAITVEGSHYASPVITAMINSGSGFTNESITLRNAETGVGIVVTTTWVAGDTLEVDCANKTVRINGSYVDYTGGFPTFYPGSRVLSYIDTFTTRSVTLSASYYKRYN